MMTVICLMITIRYLKLKKKTLKGLKKKANRKSTKFAKVDVKSQSKEDAKSRFFRVQIEGKGDTFAIGTISEDYREELLSVVENTKEVGEPFPQSIYFESSKENLEFIYFDYADILFHNTIVVNSKVKIIVNELESNERNSNIIGETQYIDKCFESEDCICEGGIWPHEHFTEDGFVYGAVKTCNLQMYDVIIETKEDFDAERLLAEYTVLDETGLITDNIITSVYYIPDELKGIDRCEDEEKFKNDMKDFKLESEIENFEEGETLHFSLTIFDCSNVEHILEDAEVEF